MFPAMFCFGTKMGQKWDKNGQKASTFSASLPSGFLKLQLFPVPAYPVPVLLRPDHLPAFRAVFGAAGVLCNEFLPALFTCIHCPVQDATFRPVHSLVFPCHSADLSPFFFLLLASFDISAKIPKKG